MRYCLIFKLVRYFMNGYVGGGAMQVRTRKVAKIKGLAGGEVGRKNSAQLFLGDIPSMRLSPTYT